MKNIKILSLIFLVGLFSFGCSDDETQDPVMIDWTLDGSNMSETHAFNTGSSTMVSLDLVSSDLCPAYGVNVTVIVDRAEQYNELIETFDFTLDITVPEDVDVSIETTLAMANPQIACITLGSVACSLEY